MGATDISQIDKNFKVQKVVYEGMKVYDVMKEPFKLYGLYRVYEDGDYKRMPKEVAEKVNKPFKALYRQTSGARIRFRTDSTKILLYHRVPSILDFPHMPRTGVCSFDLYADERYINGFGSKKEVTEESHKEGIEFERVLTVGDKKMRDILINFPLYSEVSEVYIALDEDAVVEEPKEYTYTKPVVFYGSSITQGACASHPGNCYPLMLSRRFDTDIMNLGISDGARGEDIIAEYMANLDMSVLVYDYDHNSPSEETLAATHERMFRIIREKQPNLPVIMVSASDRHFSEEVTRARKQIIKTTYDNAVKAGDKNVYFIDGDTIYAPVGRALCTVDQIHPNDIGFLMMANAIGDVLEKILKNNF